jgi:hypothetical protein
MPDLSEMVAILAAPCLLGGAFFRRWVTKRRDPERHQETVDAHRNFLAHKAMTPRQREMERQHP